MRTIDTTVRLGLPIAASLLLAACGGGEGTTYATGSGQGTQGSPAGPAELAAALPADPYAADLGNVSPPDSTTGDLVAAPEFDFATARSAALAVDVPEARGVTSYLSLCLEWEDVAGGDPEVDYDSCVLRTTMEDGRFETDDLALANQHRSVLAVVWFADPGLAPVHREIAVGGG